MNVRAIIIMLCVTVLFCAALAQGAQVLQQFTLSGKLSGENTRFDFALNSKGHAVVLWERFIYDGGIYMNDGIYYAFAKRMPNGKYSLTAPKYAYKTQIFKDGFGGLRRDNFGQPSIDFNPQSNTYLAVFFSGPLLQTYGQLFKGKNGKMKGKTIWVRPSEETQFWIWKDMTETRLKYDPGSEKPGQYRVFFRHDFRDGSGDSKNAGLFTAMLDAKGNFQEETMAGPIFKHVRGKFNESGGQLTLFHYAEGIAFTGDGSMLVGIAKPKLMKDQSYYYKAAGARIGPDGKLLKNVVMGGPDSWGATCVLPLSATRYLFVWESDWKNQACQGNNIMNSMFSDKLAKMGTTNWVLKAANCASAWAVKLANDPGSYQVFKPSAEAAFYGQYIAADGTVGTPEKLMDIDSFYGFVKAQPIPGTNKLFVVWLKSSDQGTMTTTQICGFVMDTGK